MIAEIEPKPHTRLLDLERGTLAQIDGAALDTASASAIESMGLTRDALVSLSRVGDPCVVIVHQPCGGTCRIGLRRQLADRIAVRPAPQHTPA